MLDRDPRLRAGGRAGGQVSRRPWVAPAAGGRGGPFRAAFPPVRAVAAAPDRRGGLQTTRLNHPAFYAFVFDSGIAVAIRASLDFFFVGRIGTCEGREGASQAVRARIRTTAKRVKVARCCKQLCMAAAVAGSTKRFFSRVSCGLSAFRHGWWSGEGACPFHIPRARRPWACRGYRRSDSHATAIRRALIR